MRFLECISVLKRRLVLESGLIRAYNNATAELRPNGHPATARMPNFTRTFTCGKENAIQAIRSMYGFPAAGFGFGMRLTSRILSDDCP